MPFDLLNRVFYGDSAINCPTAALDAVLGFIGGQLNDAEGEYYTQLALTEVRQVVATRVAAIASAVYAVPPGDSTAPSPLVFGMEYESHATRDGRLIAGTQYEGSRWSLEFWLDSGVPDANPEAPQQNKNPVDKANADAALINCLTDCIKKSSAALSSLGLFAVRISAPDPAKSRASVGRNTRVITCRAFSLDNYTPAL